MSETTFIALYGALDLKEQAFVDEYMESLNATLAARRVWGVTAAKQKGYALLQRTDVAATIAAGLKEQNERLNNDPDRIIRELMIVAYADPRDLIDEAGDFLPVRELAPEMRRAVSSIDVLHEKTKTEYGDDAKDAKALDLSQIRRGSTAERDYWIDQLKAEVERLRSEQSITRTTQILRYKLAPKTPALELLGRRLKMFTDRLELDASDSLSALIKSAFNRPRPASAGDAELAEPSPDAVLDRVESRA